MSGIKSTQMGELFAEHYRSLPTQGGAPPGIRHWPWITTFVGLPVAGATAVALGDVARDPSGPVLAGVGVLGGLLFGTLASVSGRIAALADGMGDRKASEYELTLIARLDIARANVAYATFLSVVFVVAVGATGMVEARPSWLPIHRTTIGIGSTFLLLHLGLTLVLVVLRINRIGKNDRVAALTAHARAVSESARAGTRP
jgi:hypothetical protein